MKIFCLIISSIIFSTSLFASSDSLAIFHRPEKVTVLINEIGTHSRLQDMMNFFGGADSFHQITADQKVMITCGRNIEAASCTFTFFQGPDVIITSRSMNAHASLSDLELESSENFKIYFESSMNDKFLLEVKNEEIFFSSSKKVLSN